MKLSTEDVARLIEAGIPGCKATVGDMTGTSDHFDALVEATAFAGKSMVQQHQMVYAALGEHILGNRAPVHALKLTTRTPE